MVSTLRVLRELAHGLANKAELVLVLSTSPAHQQVDSYTHTFREGEVLVQTL